MNLATLAPRLLLRGTAPLALLLLSGSLYGQTTMSLLLTGADQVPPAMTLASGTGHITIDSDRSISGSVKVLRLAPTEAHIHTGALGRNGPAIVTLSRGLDNIFAIPAGTRLSAAQYDSYTAGRLYVSVRSARFPDGEIRAQLPARPMRLAY